jgi:hypothetical protein
MTGQSRTVQSLNIAAAAGLVALPALGALSIYASNFVPSSLTVTCAEWLAIGTGVLYAVFFVGVGEVGWDSRNPKVAAVMRTGGVAARWYVRVPLMTLVYFGFAWVSFSTAVPWIVNGMLGSESSMAVEIDGWQDANWSRAGAQCARPTVRGVPFGMLGRHALCVPSTEKARFRAGSPVILHGRASILGITPESYRVLDQ